MTRFLALVLVAMALISGASHAQEKQKVTLLANMSPPYADNKLPEQGLAMELVTLIMTRAGYQPEITIESWSRAMEGVRIGLYDALAAAWYTEERDKDFLFSEPYISSKLILVKMRADPRSYRSLTSLQGRRLGVRVDYAYGIDFDKIPNLQLVEENHLIQNLLNLQNGAVDLVIGDQRTVALQIHEYLSNQAYKFEVVEIDLPERGRHVAASRAIKGSDKMIAAFNKALAEVIEDGSHADIIRKWDTRYSIPQD